MRKVNILTNISHNASQLFGGTTVTVKASCPGFISRIGHDAVSLDLFTGLAAPKQSHARAVT